VPFTGFFPISRLRDGYGGGIADMPPTGNGIGTPEFIGMKRKSPSGNDSHISPTPMLLTVRDYHLTARKDHTIEVVIPVFDHGFRARPIRVRGIVAPPAPADAGGRPGIPAPGM